MCKHFFRLFSSVYRQFHYSIKIQNIVYDKMYLIELFEQKILLGKLENIVESKRKLHFLSYS